MVIVSASLNAFVLCVCVCVKFFISNLSLISFFCVSLQFSSTVSFTPVYHLLSFSVDILLHKSFIFSSCFLSISSLLYLFLSLSHSSTLSFVLPLFQRSLSCVCIFLAVSFLSLFSFIHLSVSIVCKNTFTHY